MPFDFTIDSSRAAIATVTITHVTMTGFENALGPQVNVQFDCYDASSNFLETRHGSLAQAGFLTQIDTALAAGDTVHIQLLAQLYAQMQTDGHVPAGTVT